MAKSKYEYVKKFEDNDRLLPNTWLVVRIDGRGFHRFTDSHGYQKPNDERGLRCVQVLVRAAACAMECPVPCALCRAPCALCHMVCGPVANVLVVAVVLGEGGRDGACCFVPCELEASSACCSVSRV